MTQQERGERREMVVCDARGACAGSVARVVSRDGWSAGSRESADAMHASIMHGGPRTRGSERSAAHAAWSGQLCALLRAVRGQPRKASGGRSRSSGAGLCGSVKSPGSGCDALSRIAGCGSSGGSVRGTALAQGQGACGARGAGTDSRLGARSLPLVADDTWLGRASRALEGAPTRAPATGTDTVGAVNA